jgi:MFS family permease
MQLFPETATADAKRLVWAKGLRAIGDGYVSILLPAYLLALGNSAFDVGVLTTATLLGSAGLTLLTGLTISRFGHRRALLGASALMMPFPFIYGKHSEFRAVLRVRPWNALSSPCSGPVTCSKARRSGEMRQMPLR